MLTTTPIGKLLSLAEAKMVSRISGHDVSGRKVQTDCEVKRAFPPDLAVVLWWKPRTGTRRCCYHGSANEKGLCDHRESTQLAHICHNQP